MGPHLVPVVFAVSGDRIVSVVDHKPKRTTRLQRLANIQADPRVTLLADHYDDDWGRLWWVRADGTASIAESGKAHATALGLIVARYEQYKNRPPDGPVIDISVTKWSGWRASEE
jgi:PPOX class probable F420-dependent enzyme